MKRKIPLKNSIEMNYILVTPSFPLRKPILGFLAAKFG